MHRHLQCHAQPFDVAVKLSTFPGDSDDPRHDGKSRARISYASDPQRNRDIKHDSPRIEIFDPRTFSRVGYQSLGLDLTKEKCRFLSTARAFYGRREAGVRILDMASAAYYPVNDTDLSPAERAYLQELADLAADQPLEQDSRQEVRTLTSIFTVIAVIAVALRFISRLKIKAPFWLDDWLVLTALVLLFGNSAFNFVMVDQGVGLHSGRLTLSQLQNLNKVRLTSTPR